MAALACRAGAELVADDILAVAVDGSDVRCLAGSRELRLRPAAAELLAGEGLYAELFTLQASAYLGGTGRRP